MQQPAASPARAASVQEPAAIETRLNGRWLFIARAGWIVLTLLILSLSAIALPNLNALSQSVCRPGAYCLDVQLTGVDLRWLHQLGLSPGFLAAYYMGLDVGTLLVYTALAALIFWRRSQDRMALFCAYMLVLFGGATYTGLLDYLRPLAPAWYWPVGALELLGQVSFLTFFLLFPSGRFVPGWTRWGVLVAVILEAHYVFFTDQLQTTKGGPFDFLAFAAMVIGLVALQIYRYRRISTSRERQQTRWVIFGFSLAIVGFVSTFILGQFLVPLELLQSAVFQILVGSTLSDVLLLLIPISIALAILRSQLYNIDTLINRTLVYGLLTGLLAALYAGLIIGLQALVRGLTGQNSSVVIVVSTLAIAGLIQPFRRYIQLFIDRRFYRHKYDAAKVMAAFSATLRNEVDLDELREHLIAVVQETMQPSYISLWVSTPSRIEVPSLQVGKPPHQEGEAREEIAGYSG